MIIIKTIKIRYIIILLIIVALFAATGIYYHSIMYQSVVCTAARSEYEIFLEALFRTRNKAVIENDLESLKKMYDHSTKYGRWAYEHQVIKTKYLHQWAEKQGVKFTAIESHIVLKSLKEKPGGYRSYFMVSTAYSYHYIDSPQTTNIFRIGTYHSLSTTTREDSTIITLEWFDDPFADSLSLNSIKQEELRQYILNGSAHDFSDLNPRRVKAIQYADKYCGKASTPETGFKYNPKYKDYNPLGGDCANYASQVLHEGGQFRKTGTWNYAKDGSKAWVNAQAFKNYLISSGRGTLIISGTYEKVLKASFKLFPGDIVAYEKKGKITHVSVVSGCDNKGYVLVNCHNIDRYRVPWDLGWSDKGIKFHLIRVHY